MNKIKLGDNVLIKNGKYKGVVGKIIKINNDKVFTYPYIVDIMGKCFPYNENEIKKVEITEYVSTNNKPLVFKGDILRKHKKGNTFISWELDKKTNEITINVEKNKIDLNLLLYIILSKSNIQVYNNYTKRLFPYKFTNEYMRGKDEHKIILNYFKTDKKLYSNNIITVDKNMKFIGKVKLYIVDFLYLCEYRKLIKYSIFNCYLLKNWNIKLDLIYCDNLKNNFTKENLLLQGYNVPSDEYFEIINNN